MSVDEWRPSCNHFSTYGFGLNFVGTVPFTLINISDDNVSVDSRFLVGVSLMFMHEKPRSHSADDIGNSFARWINKFKACPVTLVLFLYWRKSSSASRLSTTHNCEGVQLVYRQTALSPLRHLARRPDLTLRQLPEAADWGSVRRCCPPRPEWTVATHLCERL